MSELILHHYDASPFAEKARLMLGYKGLAWRSVSIPAVMPKPDVVALTGGYRRTPFAQIGADVYCDTALIARLLERLQPEPPLFPAGSPLAPLLAQWADSTLFWTAMPYALQPAGLPHIFAGMPPESAQAFAADRAPFAAPVRRPNSTDATPQLATQLAALDAQLADGRPCLFGEAASIADFSVAHIVWFLHRAGPLVRILDGTPHVRAWYERIAAFGHGRPAPMDSAEAIAVAAGAPSHAPVQVLPGLRYEAGQAVTVTPIDYGCDPVAGTLVGLSADEVVIERSDPRAGTVHVHFPRSGFQIKQEKTS